MNPRKTRRDCALIIAPRASVGFVALPADRGPRHIQEYILHALGPAICGLDQQDISITGTAAGMVSSVEARLARIYTLDHAVPIERA